MTHHEIHLTREEAASLITGRPDCPDCPLYLGAAPGKPVTIRASRVWYGVALPGDTVEIHADEGVWIGEILSVTSDAVTLDIR